MKVNKVVWPPGTMLLPLPAVLVTCQGKSSAPNILTIAWTGIICTNPPLLSISLTPDRYSFQLIKESKEFAVNIPSKAQVRVTDLCGVLTGKKVDKFEKTGLTKGKAETIACPIIVECPINLECVVSNMIPLGSHTMFVAEIKKIQVTQSLIDRSGRLALEKAGLFSFAHGHYYQLGKQIGHFGFSVRKHPAKKRPGKAVQKSPSHNRRRT